MYYCGWDGGGSKTKVCVTNSQGAVLIESEFGPINPNGNSLDTVKNTIINCIDFMNTLPDGLVDCKGLVIGISGVSNSAATETIEKIIRECGYVGKLHIMGDQEIALEGAINGHGAVLIAGTGSVCFGRDINGETFRSGGYGYLIDDVGSGYAIARDILAAVVRSFDGRGPKTCLTNAVFKNLKINNQKELISWLYAPETEKSQIAMLSPLLLSALEQGDEVAKLIANNAAQDLAELVIAAWKNANMQSGELALVGSIIEHYDYIREQMMSILQKELPEVKLISPRCKPAQGAANLARVLS